MLESSEYRRRFPNTQIAKGSNRVEEIRTTAGGGRKAVSLGGPVTGFGAEVIVIDDLMKAQDALSDRCRQKVRDYYEQALYSRLDNKRRGRIIAIQQRLHEDDFAGYLIEKTTFRQLCLPAIAQKRSSHALYFGHTYKREINDRLWPDREPMDTLDEIREEIGSYAISAQYLQNQVPGEGTYLDLRRMALIEYPPERSEMEYVVQSWDTAIKDGPNCDYSVCTTWGWRGRWHMMSIGMQL